MKTLSSRSSAITASVLAAVISALCCVAEAQPVKKPARIGLLLTNSSSSESSRAEAFRQASRQLGYSRGTEFRDDYRFADANLGEGQLKTHMVDYKHGEVALEGYLAYDGNITGKRPGVLLVHRRDGMTDFTREHADTIAKLGYVVFAADIFGKGVLPKDIPEMQAQTAKYTKDRSLMRARAQAGLDTLRENSMVDPSRIAVIGYCFGGTVAQELIHTGAPVVGTVVVHGSFRGFTPGAAKNIKGRVLILHGAEDPTAPLSELDAAIKELRQTDVDWQVEIYSGAHHGFTTPDNPANERANARAWAATKNFFAEVFKK